MAELLHNYTIHPSIQSMLSVDSDTYILWREDNKEPFIFAGIGNAEEVEDITPVKIIWTFETEIFPDEISPSTTFREGTVCKVSVNAYERNPVVRQKCIEHYGLKSPGPQQRRYVRSTFTTKLRQSRTRKRTIPQIAHTGKF
jgi:hypothetical protein